MIACAVVSSAWPILAGVVLGWLLGTLPWLRKRT
jgi:hypothetical protein